MASSLANQAGTLLHKQLFVVLQQQILRGVMADGDRLPTQEELCQQYGVSRITVRRALADLQGAGLVRNEQGLGSFVTSTAAALKPPPTLGFVETLRQVVEETKVRVLELEMVRCPSHIAAALQIEPDSLAVHVVRTRSRKNVPLMFLEAWLPARFESVVTREALAKRPLFNLITKEEKDVGRVVQEVNAEIADPFIASVLGIELNSAVLRIERLVHDLARKPIQFLIIKSSPTRSSLLMDIAGKDLSTLGAGRLVHDR
ncbi:GntR family transcriptional regulator [Variovorax sp. J31P207]|uniref:GntR family transcriptional regulator n=1 Tax=Variovorax sp. J31P207 TaxID=3053510 RepID=UPI0025790BBD|nr:GntR family transcriptional regulator [Variovorax sp. J31P207]MDM0066753.1 GntR family transcriptional regulator [Variovorax sp. J31P207]